MGSLLVLVGGVLEADCDAAGAPWLSEGGSTVLFSGFFAILLRIMMIYVEMVRVVEVRQARCLLRIKTPIGRLCSDNVL
jgi:hypothetical protein